MSNATSDEAISYLDRAKHNFSPLTNAAWVVLCGTIVGIQKLARMKKERPSIDVPSLSENMLLMHTYGIMNGNPEMLFMFDTPKECLKRSFLSQDPEKALQYDAKNNQTFMIGKTAPMYRISGIKKFGLSNSFMFINPSIRLNANQTTTLSMPLPVEFKAEEVSAFSLMSDNLDRVEEYVIDVKKSESASSVKKTSNGKEGRKTESQISKTNRVDSKPSQSAMPTKVTASAPVDFEL